MLRERLREELKLAMKARDQHKLSTLRLILAALKDRDIAARGNGQTDGVSDDDILQLLTKMVKQRRESIRLYEQGGRIDLAGREAEEIAIIETFLPSQLDDAATAPARAHASARARRRGRVSRRSCMSCAASSLSVALRPSPYRSMANAV